MKSKSVFVCSECGASHPAWSGKCRGCGAWNTLVQEVVTATSGSKKSASIVQSVTPRSVTDLAVRPLLRKMSGIGELDRVLGGGVVPGSLILIGGEPGIGKSTLTLQLAISFAATLGTVLIASGEESAEQIALRAARVGSTTEALQIISTSSLEEILATAEALKPVLLIVDSVQVIASGEIESMAGGISQVRTVAEKLLTYAKSTGTTVVLVGHVTKEGELAGPRVLEHLVDTVLTLEGDRHHELRFLRTAKNRFGATSEVGVFSMEGDGLREVANPSEIFLAGRLDGATGSCITATIEGTRPLLVEVQALTAATSFGYPRRTASGFDLNRLAILSAVLARHAGVKLDTADIFVNIVGGLRVTEPAADLAVALAIASSKAKKPLPSDAIAFGEIGLTGEIRRVPNLPRRIAEAKKLGFKKIFSGEEYKTVAEAVKKLGVQ